MTHLEKRIIREIQGDLPLLERPFAAVAKTIGVSEKELLKKIKKWMKSGVIRRFGATMRHQLVGISANAMSAWRVPEEEIERIGTILASYREVTHCYERLPKEDWPYNLFAMIHGKSVKACQSLAVSISKKTGVKDYVLLFSHEENKKETMQYY